ncbi:MAG: ribonucleoside-diphosphate reductase, adenosylcobalamin-dependent, partial [Paludibacteraceae bacterium]|nr:ribonucleoside-diphosphate reductase, adenosylcobalamin-dependent [Paludibacteraceae bacterium]
PYFHATANDVDWLKKVQMQGAIQKWVDHSISVTINLPQDVTEELVGQLYEEAWRCGCKGCTVYRDGSRGNVLESVSKKAEKKEDKNEPHNCVCFDNKVRIRPNELECDVVRFQNNKDKWIAFVGLQDGMPYEIFTGLADDEEGLMIPKSVTKGKIIRVTQEDGTHRYDFQFINSRGFKTTMEGLSYKFDKEFWNYAKLISGVLRYQMPIDQVIKMISGLQMDSETINSWKVGVERALKKYIQDGTVVQGQVCPSCGEPLIFEEGCMHCRKCGYSKCGG